MTIHTDNLYESVLIEPFQNGNVNTLNIVAGYATSAMAFHHLNHFRELNSTNIPNVNLTIGMVPRDGMTISNHRGFLQLVNEDFTDNFQCNYVCNRPQIHSKLYIWCNNNLPLQAFIGSANYTQTALRIPVQREVLAPCDPHQALKYYQSIQADTIYCNHQDTENVISLVSDNNRRGRPSAYGESINDEDNPYQTLPSVIVSLVGRNGKVQNIAGLNWGQREGREPNQAYLQLSPEVYRSNFFPIRGVHFTVLTDDNRSFICTRAQKDANGQAIETPHNNSLLGEYFRYRLGMANGAFVSRSDLDRYGRCEVTFYKIDDETFFMDFSVN